MNIHMLSRGIALVVAVGLILAACAAPTAPPAQQVEVTVPVEITVPVNVEVVVTATPEPPAELTTLPISLGFRPTVLYAPLYVADAKGYFAEEGLKVEWEYGQAEDIMALLGSGDRPIMSTAGADVLLSRAQGIPAVYFYQWHNRDNYAIVSLADKNITKPEDLVGKTVGVPFLAGGNYMGFQAMLWSQGIKETDMTVQAIGFTQVAALSSGTVDAAVGVIYNEPKSLQAAGYTVNVIETADYGPLVPSGWAVNEQFMKDHPEVVQGFANAFTKGLAFTIQDPWEAFKIALNYVPEASGEQEASRLSALSAGIKCCDGGRLGYSDPAIWEATQNFLVEAGWLTEPLDLSQAYTNDFVTSTEEVWPPTPTPAPTPTP